MAQGLTNASIAQALHVSQSAVEKHVNSLFDKLGLSHATGYSRRVLAFCASWSPELSRRHTPGGQVRPS